MSVLKKLLLWLLAVLPVGAGGYYACAWSSAKPKVPYVTLPAEIKGEPGLPILIKADTNGKAVSWMFVDPGLSPFPLPWELDDDQQYVTGKAGRYRVVAVTALGDKISPFAVTTVIIGNAPPVPPPFPPVPPNPPVPPGPVDAFAKAVQEAYTASPDADKASSVAFLAAVYKSAASGLLFLDAKTTAEVLTNLKEVIATPGIGISATAIQKVRRVIADELNKDFAQSVALDDAAKEKLKAAFAKVQKALEGVK